MKQQLLAFSLHSKLASPPSWPFYNTLVDLILPDHFPYPSTNGGTESFIPAIAACRQLRTLCLSYVPALAGTPAQRQVLAGVSALTALSRLHAPSHASDGASVPEWWGAVGHLTNLLHLEVLPVKELPGPMEFAVPSSWSQMVQLIHLDIHESRSVHFAPLSALTALTFLRARRAGGDGSALQGMKTLQLLTLYGSLELALGGTNLATMGLLTPPPSTTGPHAPPAALPGCPGPAAPTISPSAPADLTTVVPEGGGEGAAPDDPNLDSVMGGDGEGPQGDALAARKARDQNAAGMGTGVNPGAGAMAARGRSGGLVIGRGGRGGCVRGVKIAEISEGGGSLVGLVGRLNALEWREVEASAAMAVGRFTGLTRLTLGAATVLDEGTVKDVLWSLKGLVQLQLDRVEVGPKLCWAICRLPLLTSLTCHDSTVTVDRSQAPPQDKKLLPTFPRLKLLSITRPSPYTICERVMWVLTKWTRLKHPEQLEVLNGPMTTEIHRMVMSRDTTGYGWMHVFASHNWPLGTIVVDSDSDAESLTPLMALLSMAELSLFLLPSVTRQGISTLLKAWGGKHLTIRYRFQDSVPRWLIPPVALTYGVGIALNSEDVATIATCCPTLTYLKLEGCLEVTDEGVLTLARGCTGLQRLSLYNLHQATNTAILVLYRYCHVLEYLDLSDAHEMSRQGIWPLLVTGVIKGVRIEGENIDIGGLGAMQGEVNRLLGGSQRAEIESMGNSTVLARVLDEYSWELYEHGGLDEEF